MVLFQNHKKKCDVRRNAKKYEETQKSTMYAVQISEIVTHGKNENKILYSVNRGLQDILYIYVAELSHFYHTFYNLNCIKAVIQVKK